jgi:surface antigen
LQRLAVFGARFSKEVLGLGLALGLVLALVEPFSRMISDLPPWRSAVAPQARSSADPYNLHRVPYGIDRGVCDRSAVAADIRDGLTTAAEILVGSFIGAKMDTIDQTCVSTTLEYAQDQRRVLWRNGNTGLTYTVIAGQTFETDRGTFCREYSASATNGGRMQDVQEQACRQPSGSWKMTR